MAKSTSSPTDVDMLEEETPRIPFWHPKSPAFPKFVITLLLVGAIIALFIVFDFAVLFTALLEYLESIPWWQGPLVLIAVYIVATVLFIPGSILTIGAGLLFDFWLGFATVSVASTAGASLAFLLGRYLFREGVEERASRYPKFVAIDKATEEEGWKIVGLLRLAPVMPFNALNYALSLTSVPFPHYVGASWIGMMPGTALYVWFGAAARSIGEIASGNVGPDPGLQIGLLVATGVIVIVVVVYITRYAKKKLTMILEEEEGSEGSAELQNVQVQSSKGGSTSSLTGEV